MLLETYDDDDHEAFDDDEGEVQSYICLICDHVQGLDEPHFCEHCGRETMRPVLA